MKICIILGTRPEIIKFTSIIRYCEENNIAYFIIHTNQHYTEYLDKIFFEELELDPAKHNLNVGSATHGKQTGMMLERIEEVLMKERPSVILVEGDTNTVLAGALAASKLHIKVGHVEAGLRSYDERMPEETNRVLTDHMSDFLFAPTENQKKILINEDIKEKKIFVVGNTIVDAVFQNRELAAKKDFLKEFSIEPGEYFLVTVHREENTDVEHILRDIFESFKLLYEKYNCPIFYPIHPRTRKMIDKYNIEVPEGVILNDPVGYLKFIQLMVNAKLILTDSGGIQEESCILQVPCVTVRDNTERPETVHVGSNKVGGTTPSGLLNSVEVMLTKERKWGNPFGDGKTGARIVKILEEKLK